MQNKTEEMETDMETFSKEASSASGNLLEHVKVENKERFKYGDFLRKFAVLREEMAVMMIPSIIPFTVMDLGFTATCL